MESYLATHRRSIEDPEGFWREQAELISWHEPFVRVLDDASAPINRWFVGGKTNLCYNALDRHLADRSEQAALVLFQRRPTRSEPTAMRPCTVRSVLLRQCSGLRA